MSLKTLLLFIGSLLFVQDGSLDLRDFRWKNRILLIFVPNSQDWKLLDQKEILLQDRAGLIDRNLLVFEIIGDLPIKELVNKKTYNSAPDLLNSFDISRSEFTVLLIGKDGSEKLRDSSSLTSLELYSFIDSMPMRKAEMKNKH